MKKRKSWPAFFLLGLASGCANIPDDWGRAEVDTAVAERGRVVTRSAGEKAGQERWRSIDVEQAIQISLINNPQIKAEYARLGFGAADVYRASRIGNPIFSLAALDPSNTDGSTRLSYGLIGSFTDLLTLPQRKKLAGVAFAALKAEVGARVLELAADTEVAFYTYLAARQTQKLRELVATAADLSAELAERFYNAGNISPRELAQARSAAAQAKVTALSSAAETFSARYELAMVLGVSIGDEWQTVEQLPLPPANEQKLSTLLTMTNETRLDFAAAKQRVVLTAGQKNFTAWSRWLGEFNIGVEKERESDGEKLFGPSLELELPVFNQNADVAISADAEMRIAGAELEQLAIKIENDVRLAHMAVINSRQKLAEIRDALIPMRVAAISQAQREQNYMLIGAFELIQSKQFEYDSYAAYIAAVRDYWLARTRLTRAVGRTLTQASDATEQTLDVEELIHRPGSRQQHQHHHRHGQDHTGASQ